MHMTHDKKAASQGDSEYGNDITPPSERKTECTTFISHDGTSHENAVPDGSDPIIITDNGLEEEQNKAPDGGWGWFVVLAAMLTHVLVGGFERANGIFYLQFKERFHGNATTTAWVLSLFATFRLVGGPVASALCNRYSCRTVIYLGAAIATIGIFISGYATSIGFLFFSYGFLGGIGRSLCYTPSLIIVGYYFNKRRGLAVGLSTLGVGIGTFLMPPTVEVLTANYGFQGAFLILTAIISNNFISGALSRPLEKHRKILQSDRLRKQNACSQNKADRNKLLPTTNVTSTTIEALGNRHVYQPDVSSSMEIIAKAKLETRRSSLVKRAYKKVTTSLKGNSKKDKKPLLELSLLRNFTFLSICVSICLYTISFNSTFVFLPAIAKERGLSQMQCAYLVSIIGASDGVSRFTTSVILDLKKVKPYRILVYNGVMFVAAVISFVIPSLTTFVHFVIISVTYGIFSGMYISQKSVVIVDVLGVEKLASAFGLILLSQGIACLIGPIVGGLIKDYLGHYDGAFYFGAGGIVLGGFILMAGNVVFWREKKEKGKHGNN